MLLINVCLYFTHFQQSGGGAEELSLESFSLFLNFNTSSSLLRNVLGRRKYKIIAKKNQQAATKKKFCSGVTILPPGTEIPFYKREQIRFYRLPNLGVYVSRKFKGLLTLVQTFIIGAICLRLS